MSDTTTPAAITPGLARLRSSTNADAIRGAVIAQSKAALAAAATTKAAATKANKAAPKKTSKPAAKPARAKAKKPEPGARQPKFAYTWDEAAKIEILVPSPPLRAGALARFKMACASRPTLKKSAIGGWP